MRRAVLHSLSSIGGEASRGPASIIPRLVVVFSFLDFAGYQQVLKTGEQFPKR